MITLVSAVSTHCHLHSAAQADLIVPRTRTVGFGLRSFPVARWSVSMEQSATRDENTITDTRTVLKPAENWDAASTCQRTCHNSHYKTTTEHVYCNWTELKLAFWHSIIVIYVFYVHYVLCNVLCIYSTESESVAVVFVNSSTGWCLSLFVTVWKDRFSNFPLGCC